MESGAVAFNSYPVATTLFYWHFLLALYVDRRGVLELIKRENGILELIKRKTDIVVLCSTSNMGAQGHQRNDWSA